MAIIDLGGGDSFNPLTGEIIIGGVSNLSPGSQEQTRRARETGTVAKATTKGEVRGYPSASRPR